jgi:ADP-dependent NAD(P)H-hydrate dehydratase / NAD(P)H-hydrate epimerase
MSLLLTAAQMRAVDRAAIAGGVPGLVLMENAGRGVAELILRRPEVAAALPGMRVAVVCGAGQNGGDGFVVARHLANRGAAVTVLLAMARSKISGDAATYLAAAEHCPGVVVTDASADGSSDGWQRRLQGSAVLVDALFGTGLRAEVTGVPAAAIAALNASPGLRVAVDIPSGLDADTGRVHGIAVRADLTATMGTAKLGLVLDPEAPVGEVEVVDLGVAIPALSRVAAAEGPLCRYLDQAEVVPLLRPQRASGHKGSRGHLLLVAGSPGKTGAGVLSARGAFRAGAGLCTIASTAAGQVALDAKVLEPMTACYAGGDDADGQSFDHLALLTGRMKAAALGPGIPTGPGMAALVARLARELPLPLVIDADGLNLLGPDGVDGLGRAPAPRVLTPHPGEMARLSRLSTEEVQRDRLGVARQLAARSGAVVVLKGARTIISRPDGSAFVNPAADPALGTAGSGDVLTGVIGGLLAQGLPATDAAVIGVHAHGLAGAEARAQLGSRNLMAGDLPEAIARVLEQLLRLREADGQRGG